MPTQNYQHHSRYYSLHHFIFYPFIFVLILVSGYAFLQYPQERFLWFMNLSILLLLCFLALMLRQHYALINQNRTVRMELRFRYYVLTQKRFESLEALLSAKQVYALRFAPDDELPALAEKAAREQLSPDTIKRSIRNWLPDTMRV